MPPNISFSLMRWGRYAQTVGVTGSTETFSGEWAMIITFLFTGCEQDDVLVPEMEVEHSLMAKESGGNVKIAARASTNVTYHCSPAKGVYTPNSDAGVLIGGHCGTHVGGVIKSRVVYHSGNRFILEIRKQNGGNFSNSGRAYVKAGSLCGSIASNQGSATYYDAGDEKITMQIRATFDQGITHFYPMVIDDASGTRYYAEPIMIYTDPVYDVGPYWNGKWLASVNGVGLYASDVDLLNDAAPWSTYQCTDFCKRYYSGVYGISFSGWGNASGWFSYPQYILDKISNGSAPPRVGDTLCFGGGSGDLGRVAIITEVSSSSIKVAHQNAGGWEPIGYSLSRSGNTISPPHGYTIQGWLRAPVN